MAAEQAPQVEQCCEDLASFAVGTSNDNPSSNGALTAPNATTSNQQGAKWQRRRSVRSQRSHCLETRAHTNDRNGRGSGLHTCSSPIDGAREKGAEQ